MRAQIFVEGIADQKFIGDYLKHLGLSDIDVVEMEGKDGIEDTEPFFELNFKKGIPSILIIDADENFVDRKKEIEGLDIFKKYALQLFLFPNHKENGDLETSLENIVNPQNFVIFDCWNDYESCLNSKTNPFSDDKKYTTPARKTKIYAYLEALLGTTKKQKEKIKESKRNYTKTEHWDLNTAYLNPLQEFLTQI